MPSSNPRARYVALALMMGCPNPACPVEFIAEDEGDQGDPATWFMGEPPDDLLCPSCQAPLYRVADAYIEGITDA